MQLRRLGAASLNLFSYRELCDEAREREAEEELRLFHVAATRARERLILSGVVAPRPASEIKDGTSVLERIVQALAVDREADSTLTMPPPEPREGLDAGFAPSELAIRVNAASPERAAELSAVRGAPEDDVGLGEGPAPLIERRPPVVPSRPLSYTAIEAYGECAYRFYMERVLDLGERVGDASRQDDQEAAPRAGDGAGRARGAARGAAVHSLIEWSLRNGWVAPPAEIVRRHATAAGLALDRGAEDELRAPIDAWLGSPLFQQRVSPAGTRTRAEVPLLLGVSGAVLRGSIDLLVEGPDAPPLVIDYKTDRLAGSTPAERAGRYEVQRTIYALAVAESRRAPSVEVAYVFLERPTDAVLTTLDTEAMERGRARIAREVERIGSGEFAPAPLESRDWDLCRGCPALGRLCSGPERSAGLAAGAEADAAEQG
jgi:ATP-dependent exoDNAse (exonuclease V) beta subunit